MEIFLLILGIIGLLAGLAGAVLPIPGPPLSFLGLLFLHWSKYITISTPLLWTFGVATVVIAVLDYMIPIWGTKRFGGTRGGTIGAMVGMLVGLLLIPGLGLFIGTFLGAFVGERIYGTPNQAALKAAAGSFLGFVTGILMKVSLCIAMILYAIYALFS